MQDAAAFKTCTGARIQDPCVRAHVLGMHARLHMYLHTRVNKARLAGRRPVPDHVLGPGGTRVIPPAATAELRLQSRRLQSACDIANAVRAVPNRRPRSLRRLVLASSHSAASTVPYY